jgi:hypothetical protein
MFFPYTTCKRRGPMANFLWHRQAVTSVDWPEPRDGARWGKAMDFRHWKWSKMMNCDSLMMFDLYSFMMFLWYFMNLCPSLDQAPSLETWHQPMTPGALAPIMVCRVALHYKYWNKSSQFFESNYFYIWRGIEPSKRNTMPKFYICPSKPRKKKGSLVLVLHMTILGDGHPLSLNVDLWIYPIFTRYIPTLHSQMVVRQLCLLDTKAPQWWNCPSGGFSWRCSAELRVFGETSDLVAFLYCCD